MGYKLRVNNAIDSVNGIEMCEGVYDNQKFMPNQTNKKYVVKYNKKSKEKLKEQEN